MAQFSRRSGRLAQLRDVQKDTHCLLRSWLKAVPKSAQSPCAIVLDACNASPAARREMVMAAKVGRLLLLLFHPMPEEATGVWAWLVKRLSAPQLKMISGDTPHPAPQPLTHDHIRRFTERIERRQGHPLLPGCAAEQAVRSVFSGLQFPSGQEAAALAAALPGCRVERCTIDPFGKFDSAAQQVAHHILAGAVQVLPPQPPNLGFEDLPPAPHCQGTYGARSFLQRHATAEAALFETLALTPVAHLSVTQGRQVVQVRPDDNGWWAHMAQQSIDALIQRLGVGEADTKATGSSLAMEVDVESVEGNPRWFTSWVTKATFVSNPHVPASHTATTESASDAGFGGGLSFRQRLFGLWNINRYLPELHLTVSVLPTRQPDGSERKYFAQLQAEGWADAPVEVLVHRMLFDYKGLCWDVSSVRRRTGEAGGLEELPPGDITAGGSLHVTLGTVGAVKPVYCGAMRENVDRWLRLWTGTGPTAVESHAEDELPAAKHHCRGLQQDCTTALDCGAEEEGMAEEVDGAMEEDGGLSQSRGADSALSNKKRKRDARRQCRSTFLIVNFRRPLVLEGRLTMG
eukprot:GGOE01037650.1.p1 GENE.GGOE01037650.1~~GGOE01037650.1.p1  ORF type:complete len:605 (+),score=141.23 GGOE01037650.1:94-1815(+)